MASNSQQKGNLLNITTTFNSRLIDYG